MYYEAKKETLVLLYRHTLLTAEQLAICLHYKQKSIYNIVSQLKEEGLIRSIPLPFLKRHHVGYTLTTKGAKAGASLVGEETIFRAKTWTDGPVQIEHFYGTNAFFTDLIRCSLPYPEEGLVEWLDPRSAAERYVQTKTSGKSAAPVKPDGFGMYRFPSQGRLAFHLEYDTGTETLWRLKEKLLQYGTFLPKIWPDVGAVQVLFVMKVAPRSQSLIEIWEALCQGTFHQDVLPNVFAIPEDEWRTRGAEEAKWLGSGSKRQRLKDMPLLPLLEPSAHSIIGKQPRESPPNVRRSEEWN